MRIMNKLFYSLLLTPLLLAFHSGVPKDGVFFSEAIEIDTATTAHFNAFLDTLFQFPSDSMLYKTKGTDFRVRYMTKDIFQWYIESSHYLDKGHCMVISNVEEKSGSFNFPSNIVIHPRVYYSQLLSGNDSVRVFTGMPAIVLDDLGPRDYYLISFNQGKYLIYTERYFGPETMNSMPPGYCNTYWLERID